MKILVIVGPTSSGKTSLAIELAKKFDGELVSADSRQVYKKMDIGTGKDLPKNARFNFVTKKIGGYYLIDGIKIWGYDLVEPDEDFSVADYIRASRNIIKHIHHEGKLPIIVGGTGFYVKGAMDGVETAKIPQNKNLRNSLSRFTTNQLFEKLATISPEKAGSMNISDKKNPRRLVRAIEVAQWKIAGKRRGIVKPMTADVLYIGLSVNKDELERRIKKRIINRLETGFEGEVEDLLLSGVNWEDQSMQALGYRQWKEYLKNKCSKEEALEDWSISEKKYAKKQMVWFKKDRRINWFDQSKENWQEEVLQYVENWMDRGR